MYIISSKLTSSREFRYSETPKTNLLCLALEYYKRAHDIFCGAKVLVLLSEPSGELRET